MGNHIRYQHTLLAFVGYRDVTKRVRSSWEMVGLQRRQINCQHVGNTHLGSEGVQDFV